MATDLSGLLEAAAELIIAGPGTLKDLKKQFPDKHAELDELAAMDPSGTKYAYLPWMWKQVRQGADKYDVSRLIDPFHWLTTKNSSLKLPKDMKELERLIEQHEEELSQIYDEEDHKDRKSNAPKVLFDEDGYKAIELFNKEQIQKAGEGTSWCISREGTNFYEEYDRPGVRFIVIMLPDGSKRMAMLEGDGISQLRDEKQTNERDVDMDDMSRWVLDELGFDGHWDESLLHRKQRHEIFNHDLILRQMDANLLDHMAEGNYPAFNQWERLLGQNELTFKQDETHIKFDQDAAWTSFKPEAIRLMNAVLKQIQADWDKPGPDGELAKSAYAKLQDFQKSRSIMDFVYKLGVETRHGWALDKEFKADLLEAILAAALKHLTKPETASLLEAAAHRIEALHFSDFLGKSFEEFRSKYTKLAKKGGAYGIFVQFTSHASDPLDRNAFQNPDHSDPAGVYGYPLAYVLKNPADIWYGQGARFLRVLRNKAGGRQLLDLQSINEGNAISYLSRIGAKDKDGKEVIRATDADRWMKATWKKFKARLGTTGNKIAKTFFLCMQQEGPDKLEPISAPEQSKRFLKLGFKALEDTARNQKQAVINDREPEQIVFLDRTAFEVVETFNLHGRQEKNVDTTFNTDVLDRPTAAKIATIMGDSITGEKERSSLGGWTYWWTKKGRRIELMFEQSRRRMDKVWNQKFGEKQHKANKLYTPHEAYLVVHTEIGDLKASVNEQERISDLLGDFTAQWEALQAAPNPTGWKPETKDQWKKAKDEEFSARISKQVNEKRAKQRDEFLQDVLPLMEKLGFPAPPDDGDNTLGAFSHALQTLHGIIQENPNSMDAAFKVEFNPEDFNPGAPFLPYIEYMNGIWPKLKQLYADNAAALQTDMLEIGDERYGRPGYFENFLKYLVAKQG